MHVITNNQFLSDGGLLKKMPITSLTYYRHVNFVGFMDFQVFILKDAILMGNITKVSTLFYGLALGALLTAVVKISLDCVFGKSNSQEVEMQRGPFIQTCPQY